MADNLFDTDQKKEDAISAFQGLMEHPGWKLIEKIQDANIEFFRNRR